MFKKMLKKGLMLLLCFCLVCSFTACANGNVNNDPSSEPISLVVLLSNNASFPTMNDSNIENIYNETLNAYMTGGKYDGCRVSAVIVDGQPYVPINKSIEVITTNITASKRESKAKNSTVEVLRTCIKSPALSEEIDLLKGLNIAAQLANSGEGTRKRLVVYANGLQTTGTLSMLNSDVLNGDIDALSAELVENNMVADFEGIEVVWTGMGCVSTNSQQEIPNSVISKLEAFWRKIIEKAGGNIEFKDNYISGKAEGNLPTVSTVPFAPDEVSSSVLCQKFGEDTIKFLGDQAVYVNANDAKKALEPIATFLKENVTKRILIVGTTASAGKDSSCLSLSLNRANACKKTLIEMGVDKNQIETLGLGRKECFLRVNDLSSNGKLVEELASQNRAVFIFDTDSLEADRVKQLG